MSLSHLHNDAGNAPGDFGAQYVSTDAAALVLSCTPDHIARLCRSGELAAVREGKSWKILEESLTAYQAVLLERKQELRQKLSETRKQEYQQKPRHLSTEEAARKASCTSDHIARICRTGDVSCVRVGGNWYVKEDSLVQHLALIEERKEEQHKRLAEERRREYQETLERAKPLYPVRALLKRVKAARVSDVLVHVIALAIVVGYGAALAAHDFDRASLARSFSERSFSSLAAASASDSFLSRFFSPLLDFFMEPSANIVELQVSKRNLPSRTSGTAQAPVPSTPLSPREQTIVQNITNNFSLAGVSSDELKVKLEGMANALRQEIAKITSAPTPSFPPSSGGLGNQITLLSKIDQLSGVAISGGTITGASISGGSVDVGALSGAVTIAKGGTGTTSAPSYGQVLLGNNDGGYDLVATSSLGISGGSGSGTVNSGTTGQLAYYESSGTAVSGTSTLTLSSTRRVGVGTSSPLAQLDVYGDAILSGISRYLNFGDVSGTSGYGIRDNAGTLEFKNNAGGWTGFGTGSGGQTWEISNGALAPTTTLGIIVSASSTFTGGLSIGNSTTTHSTSTTLYVSSALTAGNATTTNLAVTNVASTSNLIISNGLTFKNVSGFLKATAGVVATSLIDLAADVGTSILAIANGGTGWANIQANTLLLGNGTSRLATTSAGTNGQTLALVSGVPTWVSTTTFSSGLTYSGGNVTLDTVTVARGGTGTTTAPAGWVLYGGGDGVYHARATTTASCAGSASCSSFDIFGSTPVTITGSGLTAYDAFTHPTHWGTFTSATSTALRLTGSPFALFASSTSVFTNASTTQFTTTDQWFTGLAYSGLGVDATGKVYAAATSTLSTISGTLALTQLASQAANTVIANLTGSAAAPTAISTTSLYAGSAGQVLTFLNGGWTGAATTTFSSGLTYSGGNVTNTGVLSNISGDGISVDQTTGNVTISQTNKYRIATTSDIAVAGLAYFTATGGVTTLGSTATTSASCSGSVSCSSFTVLGSSPITFTSSALTAYDAWTHETNFGVTASATTSPLWAKFGIFASSTSHFVTASTTNLSASYASSTSAFFGSLSVGNLTGFLKATAGVVATSLIDLAADVGTSILAIANGGTGWANIQANTLLLGNGTSRLATTSAGTNGQTLALVSGVPTWVATTTAGTGLSYSGTSFTVNTSQNIATLSNLTTNGFVRTGSGNGTLSVQTDPITIAQGGTATTTFYNGGVTFYNSSLGTLSQSAAAANFFWDETNKFLGIGTTSPWAKLAVNPVAGDTNQFVVGSSTATSFIINNAGKLGLGVTSPNYLSQFHAPAGTHSVLQITNSGTGSGASDGAYFGQTDGSTLFRIYNLENDGILFATNNTERARLTADGNFGIGTSTPGTLLSLGDTGANTINISPTATSTFGSGIDIRTGCFAVNGTCVGGGSSGTSFGQGWELSGNYLAPTTTKSVIIGATTSPSHALLQVNATSTTGDVILASSTPSFAGNLIKAVTSAGTTLFQIAANGVASFASNLVPTANDGASLGISGTAFSDLFLADGGVINWNAGNYTVTHSAGNLAFSGAITLGTDLAVAHGGTGLSTFGGSNTILYTTAADTLTSNASFVFTGSKFGVGTSTPWATAAIQASAAQTNPVFEVASSSNATTFLSVAGSGFGTTTISGLTISGSATSTSNVGFNLTGGCFAINSTCVGGSSAVGGTGAVQFANGTALNGSSSFFFDSARTALGIGTSTPQWSLTAASSTGPQLALTDGSLTSSPWTFRSINGNFYLATSSPSTFATTTLPALSIDSTGKVFLQNTGVGIGTTSPWARLAVNSISGNTNQFVVGSSDGTNLVVNGSGLVGIATTSPNQTGAELDVYGDLILSGSSRYLNFGDTSGTNGYGFRDNAGALEMKNNGGTWQSVNTATTGPAFHVHKNGTTQTVTTNTATLLTWSTEEFDTNNNFDLSTERFTPTVAGKYIVTASAYCTDSTASCYVYIFKNGTAVVQTGGMSTAAQAVLATSKIVDMNGTTDYLEAWAYNGGGTTIGALGFHTFFTGILIAPTYAYAGGWTNDGTQSFLADSTDKVGVGTSSPWAKLSVDAPAGVNSFAIGSSTATYFVVNSSGNAGFGLATPTFENGGGIELYKSDYPRLKFTNSTTGVTGTDGYGFVGVGNDLYIENKESGNLILSTSNAEKARLTSAGNFGIGTTSPWGRLSVHAAAGEIPFTVGSSTTYFHINQNGKVGVGTQNPTPTNATTLIPSLVVSGGGVNQGLQVVRHTTPGAGGAAAILSSSRGSDANSYTALQSGDGIGTYFFAGADGSQFVSSASVGAVVDSAVSTNNVLAALTFGTSGGGANSITERMRITSAGNVGIGITPVNNAKMEISFNGGSNRGLYFTDVDSGATFATVTFKKDGNVVGSITNTTSATAYNTSSDRRVKENIQDTSLGLNALMRLPVRDFSFISDATHATTTGFIAQELYGVFPWAVWTNGDNGLDALGASSTPWSVDYGRITPLIVQSVQDLNTKVDTLASTTASTTPENQIFADTFFSNLFVRIGQWLADAANGITDFFANRVHTKELCVGDETGGETCITKAQLDALIAGAAAGASGNGSGGGTPPPDEPPADASDSTPDTEPPVITINGNNPAQIEIGSSYADLGASVTDNVDQNLGIHIYQLTADGLQLTEVSNVYIDTSAPGTHEILYRATDVAGNVGEATRTVVVAPVVSAVEPPVVSGVEPEPEPGEDQ